MEGVAAEATPPAEDGGQHEDILLPQTSVRQRREDPEPAASDVSDATESADSETEEDAASGAGTPRRSSSSSVHSGEDAEALETKLFMQAYVEKVFHGK